MRRNPLIAGRGRWAVLAAVITTVASLFVATGGAQAVVVSDQGANAGVYLVPGGATLPSGLAVTSGAPCADPAMAFTPDLAYLPNSHPLCDRGGSVMHSNETFALTWDPNRRYWSVTRGYVEQFLRDVADGSGSLSSPYADATQYTDSTGRATNASKYGGGCIDYGNPTGSSTANTTCLFGSAVQTGPGNNYPATQHCSASGSSYTFSPSSSANDRCLTDGDIQQELQNVVPQTGMLSHLQNGYTPLVVVLLPPQVEVCLDGINTLCSANSDSTVVQAQFCSYHSQVQMPDGSKVAYVVQPWTAYTNCDEPKLPALPTNPTPPQVSNDAGSRLVSPLSAGQMSAIVNPALDGWVATSGAEIDDNGGCAPSGADADTVPVGGHSYALQREYNNAAAIENDPYTYFGCAPDVILAPSFVTPSAVDAGDTVVFDGSDTGSTLLVPNGKYVWDFGDGTSAVGPSVVHSYGKGGNYSVTLTVTDRGGNVSTLVQPISVLGSNGLPVPPSNPGTSVPGNIGSSGAFRVRMQLLPQSLRSVLRSGIAVKVTATAPANGIAQVLITKAIAKRLHLKGTVTRLGVVIGTGTLASVKDGTVGLHFNLSRATVRKLHRLRHVTLTLRLSLVAGGGRRVVADAAGRY